MKAENFEMLLLKINIRKIIYNHRLRPWRRGQSLEKEKALEIFDSVTLLWKWTASIVCKGIKTGINLSGISFSRHGCQLELTPNRLFSKRYLGF